MALLEGHSHTPILEELKSSLLHQTFNGEL
jgi:hypothetical protein